MRTRLVAQVLFVLVMLAVVASSSPDGADGEYRRIEYLRRLELDGGVYEPAPKWIVDVIGEISDSELPENLACSLAFQPDNWTAAEALLDLILDDDVVARVRRDPELMLSYTRAVRYLRPAIVIRFAKVSQSPSESERMKLMWWADGLMRLFPYADREKTFRREWEIRPRPWNGNSVGVSGGESYQTGQTAREVYKEFLVAVGIPLDEVVPEEVMQSHLSYIGSSRSPEHWYWKGMEASWLAGSSLGPFVPPGSCEIAEGLHLTASSMSGEQFHRFLVRTEYLRVWYPLYLTVAREGNVLPDTASLLSLDNLLVKYSPEGDREWENNETT